MTLYDRTTNRRLAERVTIAETPWMRLVGWLHRSTIRADEGLWFDGCNAVHTLGMRSRVDLLFLDAENRVVATHREVRPGRFIVCCPGARAVIELGPSFLQQSGELLGHVLALEPDGDQAGTRAFGRSSARRRSQISNVCRKA